MGFANRLVPNGKTRAHAIALATDIARFPGVGRHGAFGN
jgi:enoyl-CoA hydratase